MAYRNEADEIRMLGAILAKGYIYRGLKPVNWCFDCQSALAEAEVEYEDRTDVAIDVGFEVDPRDRAALARAFGLEQLPDGPARAVIWTTTPWTIPANQALAVHPDLVYSLVETDRGSLILATELVDACLARFGIARREPAGRFEHKSPGTIARGHPISPPVLRPRITGSAWRIRHAGAGDRHRAQLAGVRRR